ncbi:uncharacterized protein [Garra rufa]|uniref:uncharacterized protein n=1 Tax=Garra rufa TaxID=137080 RepID=UPI003CCE596F
MTFIKVESEDMKIEEAFRVEHEDTEEQQTKMALIKEESEDMKIEEAFRVEREDTEERQTEMPFIKNESEEMRIEEAFSVKHEDTEERTEMVFTKDESEDVRIGESFRVKPEDTEEQQTKVPFITEESEDVKNEEAFRHGDTEEQTVHVGNCFENCQCGEMATGVFQPYMFEPESDPEFQDDEPTAPQTPRMLQPVTAWCTCGNCAVMPTEKENVCCLEIPEALQALGTEEFCELVLGLSEQDNQGCYSILRCPAYRPRVS